MIIIVIIVVMIVIVMVIIILVIIFFLLASSLLLFLDFGDVNDFLDHHRRRREATHERGVGADELTSTGARARRRIDARTTFDCAQGRAVVDGECSRQSVQAVFFTKEIADRSFNAIVRHNVHRLDDVCNSQNNVINMMHPFSKTFVAILVCCTGTFSWYNGCLGV